MSYLDCDNTSTTINPDTTEICFDGIDNNCVGFTDDDWNWGWWVTTCTPEPEPEPPEPAWLDPAWLDPEPPDGDYYW